jgi:peroxiredoxin
MLGKLGDHPVGPMDQSDSKPSRSRIIRDGLKGGTPAPAFSLADLKGQKQALVQFRGQHVLLVFCDPHCVPCNELMPRLEALHRRTPDINVIVISRGAVEENERKVEQYKLTVSILLQKQWEISMLYGIFQVPVAFLIDPQAILASEVAIGPSAILNLLKATAIRCLLTEDIEG